MNSIVSFVNRWGADFVAFAAPMFAQSAVVILLLLGLDWSLRRKARATVRYALCLLALVKLVLPPSLALPTGLAYWLPGPTLAKHSASVAPVASPQGRNGSPAVSPILPPLSLRPRASAREFVAPPVRPASFQGRDGSPIPPLTSPPLDWRAVLFLVWLSVAALATVRMLSRGRLVSAWIRRGAAAPALVLELVEMCRKQLRLRQKVLVRCAPDIGSPALCGLWRPVILIHPTLAENLSRPELRSVLLHEIAHVKRADLWVNHLQILLQIVHWYNPFVWLANARIRRLREQAVDETTLVELREEAAHYPETLLRVAKLELTRALLPPMAVPIISSGPALKERILHILDRPTPRTARLGILGFSSILLLALVMLPMACRRAETAGQQHVASQVEPSAIADEPPIIEKADVPSEPATAANYAIHAEGKLMAYRAKSSRWGPRTNDYSFVADVAGDRWRFRLVPLNPDYSTRQHKEQFGLVTDLTPDEIFAYSDGTNYCWSMPSNRHQSEMMKRGDVSVRPVVKEYPHGGSGSIPDETPREIAALFDAYASHVYLENRTQPGSYLRLFRSEHPLQNSRSGTSGSITNIFRPSPHWEVLPKAPGLLALLLGPQSNIVYEVQKTIEVGGYLIPEKARFGQFQSSFEVVASNQVGTNRRSVRVEQSQPSGDFVTIDLQKARRGNDLLTAPRPPQFAAYLNEKTVLDKQAEARAKSKPRDPPLQVGQPAPSFAAKTTDGRLMEFPNSYRGKLVLLEFWAVAGYYPRPGVFGRNADLSAAYSRLHLRGLEILAVDFAGGAGNTEKALGRRLTIPWLQVQDPLRWHGDAALKYRPGSLPYAFLLDADTQVILAEGESLRGPSLIPTIEKTLSSKPAIPK